MQMIVQRRRGQRKPGQEYRGGRPTVTCRIKLAAVEGPSSLQLLFTTFEARIHALALKLTIAAQAPRVGRTEREIELVGP